MAAEAQMSNFGEDAQHLARIRRVMLAFDLCITICLLATLILVLRSGWPFVAMALPLFASVVGLLAALSRYVIAFIGESKPIVDQTIAVDEWRRERREAWFTIGSLGLVIAASSIVRLPEGLSLFAIGYLHFRAKQSWPRCVLGGVATFASLSLLNLIAPVAWPEALISLPFGG